MNVLPAFNKGKKTISKAKGSEDKNRLHPQEAINGTQLSRQA